MGRKTPRVKGRKKGKRWAKGQSSSSNPETKKFRERAKKQNFVGGFDAPQPAKASGDVEGLNIDLLSLNDGGTERRALGRSRIPSLSADSDGKSSVGTSFGGRSRFTAATFASDWSQTSNVTFSRFLQNFQARSTHHREMLALLDAVTDIIKSRGGEENDTEYFCTLVSGLDAINDEATLTAVIPFVVMCIKKLSPEFLQGKFNELSKIFHKLLTERASSGSQTLLRGLVVSLGVILRHQNLHVWEEASTVAMFSAILPFVIHPKPKIRKAAHAAVTSVLLECTEKLAKPNAGAGPAGNTAAKFVRSRLEEGIQDPKLSLTSTLHVLELCRHVLRCFPSTSAKGICELIVQLMSLNNTVVKKVCVDVMKDFFSQGDVEIPLSAKTLGQLLSALREVKPAATDAVLMPPWITAMKHGMLTLHCSDEDLALKHLASFVPFLSSCWMTDSKPIMVAASCAMSGVIRRGIQPSLTKLVSDMEMRGKDESLLGILEKSLLDGLKFQSHQAWPLVFQIWSLFIELCGMECLDIARQGIHQLGEMRTSFEEERTGGPEVSSGTRKALGFALGKAIQVLGPRRFLEAYPLEITGREPFGKGLSRSWILPLLRDNIVPGCGAELEYFRTYLMPLADTFHARSAGAIPNSPESDKKVYGHLETQVWWLFPGFCSSAVDLASTFPKMAKHLGTVLKTRPDLAKDVATGVKNCAELAARNEGADKEAVSIFAKNFLPLFFVKYLEAGASVDIRARVMNAINAYAAIAKPVVVWSLSEKVLGEIEGTGATSKDGGNDEEKNDAERKELVYDLGVILVPHMPDTDGGRENLEKLMNHALKICGDATAGHRVQKKAYRILEAICRGETKLQRILVKTRRNDLVQALVASLAKSSPVAKVARLKCVARLLEMEDDDESQEGALSEIDEEFLSSAVGEALLCVRDSKEATRNAAYGVIVKAAGFLKNRLQCDDEESIKRLLKYLLAGLGGNPQMIACSLLALGHVCFTMREAFPKDSLGAIIDNACLLLTTASREIVSAGLSFFKVLIKAYKPDVMTPHLKKMLKALENMTDDCKKYTRMESRKMYKKLVVKFGEKTVAGLAGAKDDPVLEKRLKNIRKEVAREKRKRDSNDSDDDDSYASVDDDEDAVDTEFGSTAAGKAKGKSRSRLTLAKTPSVATTKGIDRSKSIAEILAEVDRDDEMASDLDDDGGKSSHQKQARAKKQGKAWIREKADEEIVDLLDPSASRSILAADPSSAARQQPKKKSKEEFAVSSDGRLIINDSDSDDSEEGKKNVRGKKRKLGASILAGVDANAESTKSLRNIRADDDDEEDWLRDFEDDKKSEVSGTTMGIHRRAKKVKKTNAPEPYLGAEYKAKGGKGDIKRKGLPDPYAYFPLVRDAMNRRKAAKHKAKFKSVIGGARAGAAKGTKLKARGPAGKRMNR